MCKSLTLSVCLTLHLTVVLSGTWVSCSSQRPVLYVGTRGTSMRTYDPIDDSLTTYLTSQCVAVRCRRLINAATAHWLEPSLQQCRNTSEACYALEGTQALPIVGTRVTDLVTGACEQALNIAFTSDGRLTTPSATGLCACNQFGINVWQFVQDPYYATTGACNNYNQCLVDNGFCANNSACYDSTGDDGLRTCGGCHSGFSGNGEGIATCPPCAIGQYSIFSNAVPITQCVNCSLTCPSGQGVISPCDYKGKPEDRKCGACPIGTYNNGTLLSCQSCSNVCPKGEGAIIKCNTTGLKSDRVCGVCGAGKYQSGSSLLCSDCAMCAIGEGMIADCTNFTNRLCQLCTNNTFSPGGVSPCRACTVCPANSSVTTLCSSQHDAVCTPHLVGNCTNGVAVTAGVGQTGSISCTTTNSTGVVPRSGPPAVSVVVDIIIRDLNGKEISITGLTTGQFIEFFLPFVPDALAQEENNCGLTDRHRDLECAWWDEGVGEFVTSGCTKKLVNESGVTCSCTHLTEFALILKMRGICKQVLSPQEFVLMGIYLVIFLAAIYQFFRLLLFHAVASRGLTILRNEHLLVATVSLLRGIQIVLRGEVSAPFLAIFAGVPHTFELAMYTFLVFSWIGGVLLDGSANPFDKLKFPFLATVSFFAALTIGFPIGIVVTEDVKTQMEVARAGSYCMGVVTYFGTGLVLFFGIQLFRKLHALKATHSTGGTETLALKILKLTIAISLLFCIIATLWIVMVMEEVIADDVAFPVLQFLYHFSDAMLLVTLLVMFSKAVAAQLRKAPERSVGSSVLGSSTTQPPFDSSH